MRRAASLAGPCRSLNDVGLFRYGGDGSSPSSSEEDASLFGSSDVSSGSGSVTLARAESASHWAVILAKTSSLSFFLWRLSFCFSLRMARQDGQLTRREKGGMHAGVLQVLQAL